MEMTQNVGQILAASASKTDVEAQVTKAVEKQNEESLLKETKTEISQDLDSMEITSNYGVILQKTEEQAEAQAEEQVRARVHTHSMDTLSVHTKHEHEHTH